MSHHRQRDDDDDEDADDIEETLDPPKFRLPDNFDSDRFEVWTLRMPRDFNLADLNGAHIPLNQQQQHRTEETVDFTSRKGNQKFTLQWGDARESECFRMILPRSNDSDSDDSDDDDGTFLYPTDIPFVRHASIFPAIPQKTQFELAPSMENAPQPAQENLVRHSYAPVPQKQGLKRRWTPLGGNTTVATSLSLKRKMKSSSGHENHSNHDHVKHQAVKSEQNEDDVSPRPTTSTTTNGFHSNNRILKDDPDTPVSDRKKIKTDDADDTPMSERKKAKKEKKSEKKDKKKKKKVKSES